jgi:transcriptional regulator with XRE-family HTH domain
VKDWPERPSRAPDVETARILAINILQAMDGRSLRATKALTGVDHTTISAILQGRVWPDLQTISRLEAGLGADLWPRGVASQLSRASTTKR